MLPRWALIACAVTSIACAVPAEEAVQADESAPLTLITPPPNLADTLVTCLDCPAVAIGTSAVTFQTQGEVEPVLVGSEASLFAFHGDTLTLTPTLWGAAHDAGSAVLLEVVAVASDGSRTDLVRELMSYRPGRGGRFDGAPVRLLASASHDYLLVSTRGLRPNGQPYGVADAHLRIDLFDSAWAGQSSPRLAVPVRIWRLRTQDGHGCEASEDELLSHFSSHDGDPAEPITVNQIFAPLGLEFDATVETLVVPPEWGYLVRRVPCDERQGLCFRERRREFAELYGDPEALNVFVAHIIAQDDRLPRDVDSIQRSLFGLSHPLTYTQPVDGAALPGAWLSNKIWANDDARTWPTRIIAHELAHLLDAGHHRRLSNRLLMTPTGDANPAHGVAGTAIVNLPGANSHWDDIRANAALFLETRQMMEALE